MLIQRVCIRRGEMVVEVSLSGFLAQGRVLLVGMARMTSRFPTLHSCCIIYLLF
jgi:hypothetical protein